VLGEPPLAHGTERRGLVVPASAKPDQEPDHGQGGEQSDDDPHALTHPRWRRTTGVTSASGDDGTVVYGDVAAHDTAVHGQGRRCLVLRAAQPRLYTDGCL